MIAEIITGEKMQQLCDIYIGNPYDFNYNPIIKDEVSKHVNINDINSNFNNPKIIFCYGHLINEFSLKLCYFINKFMLITGNSDQNIELTKPVSDILNCPKLIKWYGQNLSFVHDKLYFMPIGLANSMWPHGNLSIFNDYHIINNLTIKTDKIYFNFNVNTNTAKRNPCYKLLKNKLNWLDNIPPDKNLVRLKNFEFCICPEGNGYDTHRLWECLYLRVVPIVLDTPFTEVLSKYNVPMVVLKNWDELNDLELIYKNYNFNDELFQLVLNFNKLAKFIKQNT